MYLINSPLIKKRVTDYWKTIIRALLLVKNFVLQIDIDSKPFVRGSQNKFIHKFELSSSMI